MILTRAVTAYAEKLISTYQNKQTALTVAWWLVQKATGKTRTEILVTHDIDPAVDTQIQAWIAALIDEHMPVQYILGSVPFGELDILVTPPILIPRPETEEWCMQLGSRIFRDDSHCESLPTTPNGFDGHGRMSDKPLTMLDLCSGTGCIALALAHAFPRAQVTASDIDAQACELIKKNSAHNGITNCTVVQSDLFESFQGQTFSLITANPPYISLQEWQKLEPRVKKWESPTALIAQQDGLALIQRIIDEAPDYLDDRLPDIAQVWIEIGATQAEKVYAFYKKRGYKKITVLTDMYGKNRVVTGRFS